jgi:hypothetical protein
MVGRFCGELEERSPRDVLGEAEGVSVEDVVSCYAGLVRECVSAQYCCGLPRQIARFVRGRVLGEPNRQDVLTILHPCSCDAVHPVHHAPVSP